MSLELRQLYSYGETNGDAISYQGVVNDLRERNDASPAIAYVQDGTIYINIWKSWAVYDRLVRRVFLKVARQHPWLVIKSFIYDKPREQIKLLEQYGAFEMRRLGLIAILGLGATFLYFLFGGGVMRKRHVKHLLCP